MRKTLLKITTILLCVHCAVAEPQLQSKEYLPPQEGYNYGAPSIPFPSPQPTYRPPPPPPTPIYNPPIYSTPRPTFAPSRPTYGPPLESGSAISPVGQEGAGTGGGEFDHLRQPHVPGMPFEFAYAVKDDYYGNDFGHQASSNGDQVRGEYRTLLPDGRLQIVKYIADWKDGYTAEVSYQGEAKYPQQQQISPGASGSSISGASQNLNGGGYAPYAPSGYRPSVPFSQPPPSYPSPTYQPSKPSYVKPSFAGPQPGPALPSSYPTLSSPRPSNGYGQQPVSGYGGNANQPSSAAYASSPAPTYSPTGDYGNYRKK